MKNFILFCTGLLLIGGIKAQNAYFSSGYVPFHQYFLENNGNIQKPGADRDIIVYVRIGYRHDTFAPVPDAWSYSDSGNFSFNPQAWPTGGSYYNFYNEVWVNTGQFDDSLIGYGDVYTMTQQVWDSNSNSWLNSYQYMYAYDTSSTLSETFLTWNSGSNSWVDSFQYLYTHGPGNIPVSEVYQLWVNGAWQNDSQFLYYYNQVNQDSEDVIQVWSSNAWVNLFREDNSFDPNGNNTQSFVSMWSNGTWATYGLVTRGYDFNSELTQYQLQLWNGSTYVNSYDELFGYVLGNNTQFESFVYNQPEIATPVLLDTYNYDFNHDKIYELDQVYQNGQFVSTDEYYYYYTPYTVSGLSDLKNELGAKIFPDPVTGTTLNLSLNMDNSTVISSVITDAKGKFVRTAVQNADAGSNTFEINVSKLAAGTYFLQLSDVNTEQVSVLKFVKQ